MIIAWTLFVILALLTVAAVWDAVAYYRDGDGGEGARNVWCAIVCAALASVVAQYIWGGGL